METIGADFFESFDYKKNILISGPVGVGKTFKSMELLEKYSHPDRPCVKYDISDAKFKKYIASNMLNHRPPEEWQTPLTAYPLEMILRADILLYDDIGVADATDAYIRDLTYILDERIKMKRPTIYTTNLTEKELREKLNERIVSRILYDCTVVVMKGKDRRKPDIPEILSYQG